MEAERHSQGHEDERLLTAISALKQELGGFFWRHAHDIQGLVERRMPDVLKARENASDVYQGFIASYLEHLDHASHKLFACESPSHLRNWLVKAVEFAWRNKDRHYRTRGRGGKHQSIRMDAGVDRAQSDFGPYTRAARKDANAALSNVLNDLEPVDRVLFRLVVAFEFSFSAIAELVDGHRTEAGRKRITRSYERICNLVRVRLFDRLPPDYRFSNPGTGVEKVRSDLDSLEGSSIRLEDEERVIVRLLEWHQFSVGDIGFLIHGDSAPEPAVLMKQLNAIYEKIQEDSRRKWSVPGESRAAQR